jgi:hypothetical protein
MNKLTVWRLIFRTAAPNKIQERLLRSTPETPTSSTASCFDPREPFVTTTGISFRSTRCIAATRCDGHHICCGETVAASRTCNTGRIDVRCLTRRVLPDTPTHRSDCVSLVSSCVSALSTSAVPASGLPRAGAVFLFAGSFHSPDRMPRLGTGAGRIAGRPNRRGPPSRHLGTSVRGRSFFLHRIARVGSPAGGVLSSPCGWSRRPGTRAGGVDDR